MTKKERTIKACRELAAKYRNPEGKRFFHDEYCPLCIIHLCGCEGCPLANEDGALGCYYFNSAKAAMKMSKQTDCVPNPAFNARAAFFDRIIPILEKIPASRFTKNGWKYFDELDRSW